jgi:sugar porter (SP) family MFS transporter
MPVAPLATGPNPAGDRGGRVTPAVAGAAATAAVAGLLFGYDLGGRRGGVGAVEAAAGVDRGRESGVAASPTDPPFFLSSAGVTGGVSSDPAFLAAFFPSVAAREAAAAPSSPWCRFDDQLLTLFTSSAFLAAALATVGAGALCRRAGRRAALATAGALFLVGTALAAGAVHASMLILGRALVGAGIGVANTAAPIYLSEVAPARVRGAVGATFQLATTLAVFVAQVVNLAVLHRGPNAWRVSLGLAAAPAAALALGALALDDSPSSLAARGRAVAGRAALQRLRGEGADVSDEWATIEAAAADAAAAPGSPSLAGWRALGARALRPELTLALTVALGSQLNGINAILFYAPLIFSSLGSGSRAALASAVAVGLTLFGFTAISLPLVDRAGRRRLLIWGGVAMSTIELALAGVLGAGLGDAPGAALGKGAATAALVLMCSFVAAFALSWGPCGWIVPAEVWPLAGGRGEEGGWGWGWGGVAPRGPPPVSPLSPLDPLPLPRSPPRGPGRRHLRKLPRRLPHHASLSRPHVRVARVGLRGGRDRRRGAHRRGRGRPAGDARRARGRHAGSVGGAPAVAAVCRGERGGGGRGRGRRRRAKARALAAAGVSCCAHSSHTPLSLALSLSHPPPGTRKRRP